MYIFPYNWSYLRHFSQRSFGVIYEMDHQGKQRQRNSNRAYAGPLEIFPQQGGDEGAGGAPKEITDHVNGIDAVACFGF